jgi:hypothetical protein
MKSKLRNTKRLRLLSHIAAAAVVIASAVGFLSALPTTARADGCAGINCSVTITIGGDEDPVWTGDWHGDWVDEDEEIIGGGDEDPGNNGGDDPGGGNTPTTAPATTTTTIPVTTTTLSPAQRVQRQRQLMRLRLGQSDCINLLLPARTNLTAVDALEMRLGYIWPSGGKAAHQAAYAGVGNPSGTVMEHVDVQIGTSPTQTQITGTFVPNGIVMTVPASFFSWGPDSGLSGEELRSFYLLAALARPGTTPDDVLLNCFGVVLPGGGE